MKLKDKTQPGKNVYHINDNELTILKNNVFLLIRKKKTNTPINKWQRLNKH